MKSSKFQSGLVLNCWNFQIKFQSEEIMILFQPNMKNYCALGHKNYSILVRNTCTQQPLAPFTVSHSRYCITLVSFLP